MSRSAPNAGAEEQVAVDNCSRPKSGLGEADTRFPGDGHGGGLTPGSVRAALVRLAGGVVRVVGAACVCLTLFAVLPIVHQLADTETQREPPAVAVTPVPIQYQKKKEEPKSIVRASRRTVQARLGGKRGRTPDFSFTPDLSVSGGEGAAAGNVDLATFVFEEGQTDQGAVPLSRPLPPYPRRARDQGIEGTVVVELRVDREGKVADARIRSLPHPLFREVVLSTVRKWRFKPAVHRGVPVNMRVQVPFEFNLDD